MLYLVNLIFVMSILLHFFFACFQRRRLRLYLVAIHATFQETRTNSGKIRLMDRSSGGCKGWYSSTVLLCDYPVVTIYRQIIDEHEAIKRSLLPKNELKEPEESSIKATAVSCLISDISIPWLQQNRIRMLQVRAVVGALQKTQQK